MGDEIESESPTESLDQLKEALMENQDEKDEERYVVKATPMTAGPSSVETPPTLSETKNENEPAPEENNVPLEETIPVVENQETDIANITSSNIETQTEDTIPLADSEKQTEEQVEVVTTTEIPATPATPTLNKTAEEPEIPSFREWTEKALEEEEK